MRQQPLFRPGARSGAEWESGARDRARGANEAVPDDGFRGGHDNYAEADGSRGLLARGAPHPPQVGGVRLVLRRHHQGQRRPPSLDRRRQGQLLRPLYEIDGEDEDDVPHVLQLSEYRTTDNAEYDSWLLLEPLEEPAADAMEVDVDAA